MCTGENLNHNAAIRGENLCRSREMFSLPSYPVIHLLTHEICFATPILGTTVLNDLYGKACFRLLLIYL